MAQKITSQVLVTEWDDRGNARVMGNLHIVHKKIEWIQRVMSMYPDVVFEGGVRQPTIFALVDNKDVGEWRPKDDIGWIYEGRSNTWLR